MRLSHAVTINFVSMANTLKTGREQLGCPVEAEVDRKEPICVLVFLFCSFPFF